MKQMPWAWQKSPTRSCSSSGDSVSTTTCARSVSERCHPGGPHGAGMQAHLEGVKQGLRQLPGVSLNHHTGVQLGQGPLGCLGTVLAQITLPQEKLQSGHMVGHPTDMGCSSPL